MSDETDDAFLGGRLRVLQPARGYRAGTDAVMLAAAVPAMSGEAVLELGCGTGVVLLCLAARVAALDLTGVERQESYADLARRNCARNGITADIVEADIRDLPPVVKDRSFDHVLANPPFYNRRDGLPGEDLGREGAMATDMPIGDWARIGLRRLRPRGRLTMITMAEHLPEILASAGGIGVTILPVAARIGRRPERVIVSVIKGGRAPFRLLAPMIMHEGPTHAGDGRKNYTSELSSVLRDGAGFEIGLT